MNYNGINFNQAHWQTKTEAEFIAHESHWGLSVKQLKEAFALMVPKAKTKAIDNDSKGPAKKGGDTAERY